MIRNKNRFENKIDLSNNDECLTTSRFSFSNNFRNESNFRERKKINRQISKKYVTKLIN